MRWCEYPGCQDARTLPPSERFCAYHRLVLANGSDDLVETTRAEISAKSEARHTLRRRVGRWKARQINFQFMNVMTKPVNGRMTAAKRAKIAKAAKERWAKELARSKADRDANKKTAAVGKNAAAIIETASQDSPAAGVPNPLAEMSWTLEVSLERLRGSETNPRKMFEEGALQELAKSLADEGQLQRLLVRPCPKWSMKQLLKANKEKDPGVSKHVWKLLAGQVLTGKVTHNFCDWVSNAIKDPSAEFEIVAGERRWRAAKLAKLKTLKVEVQVLSDQQVVRAQYHENDKRKELTPLEEAAGFAQLIEAGTYNADSLAEMLGKSRTFVFDRLKLVKLEGQGRKALQEGKIPASIATLIAQIPDAGAQALLFKKDRWGNTPIFDGEGNARSVRAVEDWIERNLVKQIPWKMTDASMPCCPAWLAKMC